MSDTDGSKSDFDDETYGSKKRKTKQKVDYIFILQFCQFNPNANHKYVLVMMLKL